MATTIEIKFDARETLPAMLTRQARLRGLTDAEYAKRLIVEGLERLESDNSEPAEPGETLEDFLLEMARSTPKSRALSGLTRLNVSGTHDLITRSPAIIAWRGSKLAVAK